MQKTNSKSAKADVAAMGAKLINASQAAHRAIPATSHSRSPVGSSHSRSPLPTTTSAIAAVEMAGPVKKVCYDLDPGLARHLLEVKLALAQNGVTRKVNDTHIAGWALSRLPIGPAMNPEIASDYQTYIASRFPAKA